MSAIPQIPSTEIKPQEEAKKDKPAFQIVYFDGLRVGSCLKNKDEPPFKSTQVSIVTDGKYILYPKQQNLSILKLSYEEENFKVENKDHHFEDYQKFCPKIDSIESDGSLISNPMLSVVLDSSSITISSLNYNPVLIKYNMYENTIIYDGEKFYSNDILFIPKFERSLGENPEPEINANLYIGKDTVILLKIKEKCQIVKLINKKTKAITYKLLDLTTKYGDDIDVVYLFNIIPNLAMYNFTVENLSLLGTWKAFKQHSFKLEGTTRIAIQLGITYGFARYLLIDSNKTITKTEITKKSGDSVDQEGHKKCITVKE